jgi:hypothetical protein
VGWLGLTLIRVPNLLAFAQPNIWQISRPWYLAWAGLVYIAALLVTLGWIAAPAYEIVDLAQHCQVQICYTALGVHEQGLASIFRAPGSGSYEGGAGRVVRLIVAAGCDGSAGVARRAGFPGPVVFRVG